MKEIWVGVDPGGLRKFGLAFVDMSGALSCATVSSVDEAVDRIAREGKPLGLGIDAPMWWSTSPLGWRKADCRLRDTYPAAANSVLSINSLRGATLVGGTMLAAKIREWSSDTMITEAHPTVMLHARKFALDLSGDHEIRFRRFAERFRINANAKNGHERDAAICAVSAREGFRGCWTTDLAEQRHNAEQDPFSYCLKPVHYYWPEPLD